MDNLLQQVALAFYSKMLVRFEYKSAKHGFHGWNNKSAVSTTYLKEQLQKNVYDGDWVDVANLALILDYREQKKK
jgi:hypothetical protein